MVIRIKFTHFSPLNSPISVHFSSLIPKMLISVPSYHLLLDHIQFTLIHGHNIPGTYAILLFRALNFTFSMRLTQNWVLFHFGPPKASFFLELLVIALCSSPVAYWTSSNQLNSTSGVILFIYLFIFFAILSYSWGSHGKSFIGFIMLCKPLCHDKVVTH